MGFVLNIFFLPLNHQLFGGIFTALDIPAFNSLDHWQSFEVTAMPAQGASAIQSEFSVTTVPGAAQPVVPDNLKYVYRQVMKTASETEQEVEKPPASEQGTSPKPTSTLKKLISGKNKSKPNQSPIEEPSKPLPVCAIALNTHGALQNRIFTGGSDFSISHTFGDRRLHTVINHTENLGGSGSSTIVERGLIVDGTTRLLEDFESRGFLSTDGQFRWTEGFGLKNTLATISRDWQDSMYDNLLGVDCRWSIHAVIGKNAGASQQVLLGFVFHLQHAGEAFFVQVFTTQPAPQPQVPPIPVRPHSLPNVAAIPPVVYEPEPDTGQHVPNLETQAPPVTPDPLENDPTLHEDDTGIDDRSPQSTPHSGRMLTGQNTPTSGSQPGSFNQRGMPIPVGSPPQSEGYFSGGRSAPSPSQFSVQGNTPDRLAYYIVRVQQPPPALPQEPEIPAPLDLNGVAEARHRQFIDEFRRNFRDPYEERRKTYEQALRDYPQRLGNYGGTLSDEERKRLLERWTKAYRAALLRKFKKIPPSCRDDASVDQTKPNRTDFDPDGGSGSGFSGGRPSVITTNLMISR
ncbi:MAG: hypothetical protein ACR2PX_07540 [Endozoicomonas sp.]